MSDGGMIVLAFIAACALLVSLQTFQALARISVDVRRMRSDMEALGANVLDTRERVTELRAQNRYADLLDRVVMARKYDGCEWEPHTVIAVGHHGSVCLRKCSEPDKKGFWVHSGELYRRIREVD